MSEINDLKSKFKKEFAEYKSKIEGYDELEKNLDNIFKELKDSKEDTLEYNKKFNKVLENNDNQVKRLK